MSFRLTASEYSKAVMTLTSRFVWFKIFVAIILVALAAAVAFAIAGSVVVAAICLAGAAVYTAMLGWAVVLRPRQHFRRLPYLAGDQTYCFSDNEVSWTFITGGSTVKWSYFRDMLESEEMFFLRHQLRSLVQLVPKRAFKSTDDAARFRQLASRITKGKRRASATTT